jgi:hypothetical protein
MSGNKVPANELASNSNTLPLDMKFMMDNKGTSTKIVRNRNIVDTLSLLFETSKSIDEMFKLSLITPFVGHKIRVGDTAELFLALIPLDDKPKQHWLNGKWLVTRLEHFSEYEQPGKFISRVILVRPTFTIDRRSTSLSMSPLLYRS